MNLVEAKPTHKLIKIASKHNAMRTDFMDGWLMGDKLPALGECFYIVGLPISEKASHRVFNTSPILDISNMPDGAIEFATANSIYRLEVLNNG